MNKYKKYEYIIYKNKTLGTKCAYVKLPHNHKFCKLLDKKEKILGVTIDTGYYNIDIKCHGGLTFGQKIKKNKKTFEQGFTPGYWIGWDYAHLGDKTKFSKKGKEWTTKEIKEECKSVIDQLRKANTSTKNINTK